MDLNMENLTEPLPMLGVSLWNIIIAIIVLIVGIIIVRIASSILKKWMLKSNMGDILAEFASRVIRLILYIFVVGTALAFLGIEIGAALVSVSVVLGFVLGFALGDTLSNIASGFMIAITKPFIAGDFHSSPDRGTVPSSPSNV